MFHTSTHYFLHLSPCKKENKVLFLLNYHPDKSCMFCSVYLRRKHILRFMMRFVSSSKPMQETTKKFVMFLSRL
jgi:hypothetical protein